MCFICLFKLLCDEPVSTVHAEQHQSTETVIGKIAVSPLSFLTTVWLQTLERVAQEILLVMQHCSC